MMRAGFRARMDMHRAGPQLLRTGACKIDGGGAVHARRLRRVRVEGVGGYDANAVVFIWVRS